MNWQRLRLSFYFAWEGLKDAYKNEQNFKLHLAAGSIVVGAGFFFKVSQFEWLVLIAVITGILSLELVNTAIERSIDLITSDRHPLAKKAKDASAAAVFLFSLGAVIIGIVIFIPKILTWLL
ncbi:diacylglycerol kinase family protein [Jeotgalibacillus proteolyticus]|uniref:UDP kinase n=1 Tax=Jeotgalibacillus proteolyticus TaxID=2082395 RepID=A0A2S5GES4_9BACL|nr:diacylglycerol kinase family protein [Jeotgalibacillus proteolyticus]PPA71448.1 UDP kinase [Jeotgalibacillus proteolyticus]